MSKVMFCIGRNSKSESTLVRKKQPNKKQKTSPFLRCEVTCSSLKFLEVVENVR